jgi:hypothetical protein
MKKAWSTPEVSRAGTFAEATRQATCTFPGDTKGIGGDDGEQFLGQPLGSC